MDKFLSKFLKNVESFKCFFLQIEYVDKKNLNKDLKKKQIFMIIIF